MPSYFPCPNAQCTYQFDAEILPPAAMVTCPLCRTKFPYRANQPAPVEANTASSPGGAAGGPQAPAGPRVVNLQGGPSYGGKLQLVLWVAGSLAVLGVIVMVLLKWTSKPPIGSGGYGGDGQVDSTFNLRVETFPSGWDDDATTRETMQANVIGRKRTGPDAWLALVAKDYGKRNPRAADLNELMDYRLRQAVSVPEFQPLEGRTWMGQPALAVLFAGELDGIRIRGEAHAVGFKGIAYVCFTWCHEREWDAMQEELTSARDKVKFLTQRTNWEPEIAATTVYSPTGAGYQIEDNDGVWVLGKPADQWKQRDPNKFIIDDPKEHDPAAKMMFMVRYQSRIGGDGKRKAPTAEAMLASWDAGGDPLEAAREHVLARIKRDYGEAVPAGLTLEPAAGPTPIPTDGPAIGRFRFRDPNSRDNREIWIISAIRVGSEVVALEIKTLEKDITYVEEWMIHLAASLRSK